MLCKSTLWANMYSSQGSRIIDVESALYCLYCKVSLQGCIYEMQSKSCDYSLLKKLPFMHKMKIFHGYYWEPTTSQLVRSVLYSSHMYTVILDLQHQNKMRNAMLNSCLIHPTSPVSGLGDVCE